MAKPKKKEGNPEDLLKELDEQFESGKLTEEEKQALTELRGLIVQGIENGDFIRKKPTFKLILLNIFKWITEFTVSFLFVLVMFGFTFSLINDKSYLAVILSGISIAFGFVITGTTDYLRLLYDKLYLGIKIMLIILKYFTFAIINSFVFKVFDSNIILFLVVFVSDFISSIVTRRLLKL